MDYSIIAVRGAGGYYMFQAESDEELSDLDPEINIENEIEEGPLAEKHRKEKEALQAKSSPWQVSGWLLSTINFK